MLTRVAICALALVACRDTSDPGFEIVKVPLSAYASADASVKGEGGVASEAGPDPFVLCISKGTDGKTDEDDNGDGKSDDNDEGCANEWHGRSYDDKATARHRAKGDDTTVCCYRKGRVPHRERAEEE